MIGRAFRWAAAMPESVRAAAVPALLAQLRAALARGDAGDAERLAAAVADAEPGHEAASAYLSTQARLRGDASTALMHAEQGLRAHPTSALLLFNRGAAQFDRDDLTDAMASLQAALCAQPDFLLARFWLGSLQQQSGQAEASLHTRMHALTDAERQGFLLGAAQLPAEARQHIDAAIAAVHQARARALTAALQPLRERHGDAALQRVMQALGRHVGHPAPRPSNPLQEPSFLFLPGLPDRPWWPRDDFPFLAALEAATDAIRAELLDVLVDEEELVPYIDMPDAAPAAATWRALNRSPRWSGYHFYRDGTRVDAHCQRCPRTAAALEGLPLLRLPGHGPEAMFSVLRPGAHIPPHTGVINGRLTVHLPLVVPPDCGALAVAGQARPWQEGHCLVFDDSYVHEAWNRSAQTRVVLLFDVWNPALTPAERDALSAGIVALGAFNREHGAGDPMHATA